MPDLATHTSIAASSAVKYSGYGFLGSVIALIFDVDPSVVMAALIGSMFAVILLHTFSFKVASFIVTLGTFGASYAVPFITDYIQFNQKGLAFLLSFFTIYFWSMIKEALRSAIKRKIDGV